MRPNAIGFSFHKPMPTLTYRTATEQDLPTLAAFYTKLNNFFYTVGYRLPQPQNVGEVWLSTFQRTIGRFSQVYVAELDGEIVGFMLCRLKRVAAHMGGVLVGELSDMWIEDKARRMGIGDKLSRLALNWLRENGAHSVEIQVLRDNEASWQLYQRMGFQLEFRVGRLLWDEYRDDPKP